MISYSYRILISLFIGNFVGPRINVGLNACGNNLMAVHCLQVIIAVAVFLAFFFKSSAKKKKRGQKQT